MMVFQLIFSKPNVSGESFLDTVEFACNGFQLAIKLIIKRLFKIFFVGFGQHTVTIPPDGNCVNWIKPHLFPYSVQNFFCVGKGKRKCKKERK